MSGFKDELKNRWQERKTGKAFSWTHLVVRILILFFLVLIIRFFASDETDKFRDFLQFDKTNNTEIKDVK
mgnify:CR=1 FL=1|jgi:hypothetical protein